MQEHLQERVRQIAIYWDNEIRRQNRKIFKNNIRKIDINKFALQTMAQMKKNQSFNENDNLLQ